MNLLAAVRLAASDWSVLQTINVGSKLTAAVRGEGGITGKLFSISDANISLEVKHQTRQWPRPDVLQVSKSKRGSMKKPLLLGMAIGAAAGSCGARDFICFDRNVTMPAGAVVGTVMGATAGTIVGLFRRQTAVRYQKPTSDLTPAR